MATTRELLSSGSIVTERGTIQVGNSILGQSEYAERGRDADNLTIRYKVAATFRNAVVSHHNHGYTGPYASPFLYVRSKKYQPPKK